MLLGSRISKGLGESSHSGGEQDGGGGPQVSSLDNSLLVAIVVSIIT